MKAIVGAAISALGLITAGGAQAQSLYFVDLTDSGMVVVDRDSLQWRDNRPQIDVHIVYRTPIAFTSPSGDGYDWIQRAILRYDFDCAQPRNRILSFRFMTFAGTQSGSSGEISPWDEYDSQSPSAAVRELACKNTVPTDVTFNSIADAAFVFYEVENEEDEGEDK
ncbi:surface-adhesin E family protein [Brevundimonas sp.]|uniref:surface-adhesin E family protein n=1 Tax=Brevundimonas sp. TaxID=1871086 RepID=UPI002AB835BA|nr:surface-adhesin E family protein [Brevundimonas sp.]MDZ4364352.1 hypothetical protein [Brevundimonas sp.]